MLFGLQLDKLKHVPHEEFEELNWLPASCRFKYCVSSITLRYFNEQPYYLSKVFDVATRKNCRNLKCLIYKSKNGQFPLSYIDPTFWNKTLDILKRTTNSNAFNRQT